MAIRNHARADFMSKPFSIGSSSATKQTKRRRFMARRSKSYVPSRPRHPHPCKTHTLFSKLNFEPDTKDYIFFLYSVNIVVQSRNAFTPRLLPGLKNSQLLSENSCSCDQATPKLEEIFKKNCIKIAKRFYTKQRAMRVCDTVSKHKTN